MSGLRDLHVWEVASGFPALSAHVLVDADADCHAARRELERMLAERFDIEHTTLQVDHSREGEFLQLEEANGRRVDGRDRHAFVFADIAGFTALTEALGDERALQATDDFEQHTRRLLDRHGGEQVKALGDGLMLRVSDAAAAIRIALELSHHEMARPGHPKVGLGIDYGPALERGGDWLGTTVNVAARIADLAAGGEVLASEAARNAAGTLDSTRFVDRGPVRLRNLAEEVRIFEVECLDEAAALFIDPVCHIGLDPANSSVTAEYRGIEYAFCSKACRERFVASPDLYLQGVVSG